MWPTSNNKPNKVQEVNPQSQKENKCSTKGPTKSKRKQMFRKWTQTTNKTTHVEEAGLRSANNTKYAGTGPNNQNNKTNVQEMSLQK